MAGRPASALTKARIELIQAQRDGQELKNAQLRGALVISEEVERRWSDILRLMRAGLLALPSRVAQRLPHLTRGDKTAIEDEIRAILEELAAAGPEPGSGGAEAAPAATSEPWIEANLRLPEGTSALPGPVKLWPYQRGIADAIGDPEIERVTLVKSVRVGFTTLLSAAVGNFVANEPCPVLCLLPTESDCRDYVVSDIEPLFEASVPLRGLLAIEGNRSGDRSTIMNGGLPVAV